MNKRSQFEQVVVPHLDAAFNLARWLTGQQQDAEDVVQEAYLRAFRFFDSYHGGDSRVWLLTIVRHTAYTWLRQNRMRGTFVEFDEEISDGSDDEMEGHLLEEVDIQQLREALAALPVEFREVVILRDMEGLAYKEIATVAHVPLGTVMSRLSRARARLYQALREPQEG